MMPEKLQNFNMLPATIGHFPPPHQPSDENNNSGVLKMCPQAMPLQTMKKMDHGLQQGELGINRVFLSDPHKGFSLIQYEDLG